MLRQEFIYICRFVTLISSLFHVFGELRAISRALSNFIGIGLNDRGSATCPRRVCASRDGVTADTDRCNKPSYSGSHKICLPRPFKAVCSATRDVVSFVSVLKTNHDLSLVALPQRRSVVALPPLFLCE